MIPEFYVFKTEKAAELIKNIEYIGFNAFVSGKSDEYWLRERFTNPKKYLLFWDPNRFGNVGAYNDTPLLCISFQEEYDNWVDLVVWIQAEIFKEKESEITVEDLDLQRPATQRREYVPPGEEVVIDGLKSHVVSYPPQEVDLKKGYSFDSIYDETYDVKYFEVYSPSSETPFTVVVNNYSKKDDTWLFSDIFASNAWARNNMESRYDFHFLTVLWKHLGLPGEFTMDVVKRRVDACYPNRVKDIKDLEPEPQVYRRPMSEVMGMKRKRCEEPGFINTTPRLQ